MGARLNREAAALMALTITFLASFCFLSHEMLTDAPSDTADWPMYQHDATHSGYTNSAPPTDPVQLWNFTVDPYASSHPATPAVANGYIYQGINNYDPEKYQVSCFNAATKFQVWSFPIGGAVTNTPAVADDHVYVGSTDGNVYCLNARDGTKIWNNTVRGLSRDSADVSITFEANRLFLESWKGNVFCLDARDGSKVWNFSTGVRGTFVCCPAVADGKVFAGNDDGAVFCLNASNGSKIWNYTIGKGVNSPTVVGGFVYVGSADGNAYCLDENTGEKIWNYTTWFNSAGPSHGYYWGNTVSTLAAANGRVYVGSSDFLVFCLDAASGTPIWNFTTGAEVYAAPTVANGAVLVGSYDGKLYCLNATDGTQIWVQIAGVFSSVSAGGSVGSPSIAGGTVYVVGNGVLQAYGAAINLNSAPSLTVAIVAGIVLAVAIGGAILLLRREKGKRKQT